MLIFAPNINLYIMKLNKFLLFAIIALLLPCVSSCKDDEGGNEPEATNAWLLPVTDFSKSLSDIKSSEEQRGFTTAESDLSKLTASKNVNGTKIEFTYNFDPVSKAYEYVKGSYSSDNDLQDIAKLLNENGYTAGNSANGINLYINTANSVQFIFNTDDKEFFAVPSTTDVLAWGRIDDLSATDKAGLIVPYLGKYATVELVSLFEKYHGNTLNEADSKIANGVYVYDVANNAKGYTQVKYWFDVKTKSQLEEAAVYFDAEKRPSTEDVDNYMNYLGMKYTSMVDASDGSSIYFNYTKKFAAYLLMDKPDDESAAFTPNIHFTFSDLESQLPPETVSLPEPIVEFGTMTLDEAVEQYKKKDYYTGTTDDGFGGALGIIVTTSSPDFPQILLMDDGGKYYAAMLIATDALKLRSPYVKEWLGKNDYEYKPKASVLPTYVSKDKKVMAQFDMDGMFTGAPTLSFQPNEYTGE